ncbi:FAD-linked oxidoreductase sor8 [Penicillium argentinense]|uniref:FAD-linked oxidoreductase sor8 n=1 Tax=Penicillium argentinense TaxID=1131581 RepID=A0A9W9K2V8_9EURO|nr:FAD-linked oxidoreductase sor8 [Penicillium argentinense]KAJ5090122.1 FAD-linked oxidoreductase sor8 [Penicillium argentinense]
MHLQGLLFLPLALPIVHAGFKATRPSCRCFPGEPCWPTVQQWSDFNATLGGKLISTVPIGSVCHTSGAFAAYDAQGCADLLDNWAYPTTHYESSSSPMASWFANFSCDPFLPHRSCEIGSLQPYAVNVSGPEDVQATLRFTRKHNIRLVIRNTGHDYLGKSTAPGAVALWMHNLKDTQHLQYTSPSYNGSALRLGAGIQGYEAMAAAHAHNKVVVSGNCESVGVAGGYSQAGGHGQLASQFGLGADQVLEWEVVTADGKLRRASPTENSDLHWAITGGGGGTYAVVLSATVKAHAELITSSANLTFSGTDVDPAVFWEVVQTFIVDIQPLVDAGAVAIWAVAGSSFMLTPIAFPGGSLQQLQAGLASTLALLDQHNITYTYHIEQFDTFWDSYAAMNPHSNITEAQIGGRLMPRSVIDSKIPALISVLQGIADEGVVISGVSLNVSRAATPRNAVNPVWRDAAISFVLGT